jgi:FAD/FMN-containing dehydrogenase
MDKAHILRQIRRVAAANGGIAPGRGVFERETEIKAACVRAGGTISGEHGIGIEKMPDMRVVFSPDDLAAQKAVHDALDPRDLSNPGKIFPA